MHSGLLSAIIELEHMTGAARQVLLRSSMVVYPVVGRLQFLI